VGERFPVRRWAIESANGHGYLLAQQLVAAGEQVVDVPSTLSARVRVLDSTRSQKNDPNDAWSVAIVALRQPGLRVVAAEDHVAVLRMLAKRHKQLAGLKTQAAARLHALLATLIPGGLGIEMVPRQAAELLRRVQPETMVETERKHLALLGEVRGLETELQDLQGASCGGSGSVRHVTRRYLLYRTRRCRVDHRLHRRRVPIPHQPSLSDLQRNCPHRSFLGSEETASAQPTGQPNAQPRPAPDRHHPATLPGTDRVLVLAAADEQALLDGLSESTQTPTDAPWSAVNIHTGTLTQLGARWEQGPLTWVAPRDDTA
jgi:hypothetical protein